MTAVDVTFVNMSAKAFIAAFSKSVTTTRGSRSTRKRSDARSTNVVSIAIYIDCMRLVMNTKTNGKKVPCTWP